MRSLRRLAVIPARGGSKRIPHKNIKEFCGSPIISYILTEAKLSGLFVDIHVSTDDKHIFDTCCELGFRPDFLRPSSLADDMTPIMPVVKYVTDQYRKTGTIFDEVWVLMACSPLIKSSHLINMAQVMHDNPGKSALAVCEYSAPIEWAFTFGEDFELMPRYPGSFSKRSQDLEKHYYDSGSIAAFSASSLEHIGSQGTDCGFLGVVIPKINAIDIDEPEDWILAEAIYRGTEVHS